MSIAAYPLSRLLDNGMDYTDAWRLHARVEGGAPWCESAEALGAENLARARDALDQGQTLTARDAFRRSAMCFRFAQADIPTDDERKRSLYRRLVDAFGEAARLDTPPVRRVEVPYGGGVLAGWLTTPANRPSAPLVFVFGGADAWRETYWVGARFLVERGVAACLVDLPGQGEARLFGGLYTRPDSHRALSALADAFPARRLGVWGNSLGGYFAARAAAADERFAACCVNGGSARPVELLERLPDMMVKLRAMAGATDDATALAVFSALALDEPVRSPLLVLHGMRDRVFPLASAQALHDRAVSPDRTLRVWDDGEHCLYNHSHEKHCLVADWFAARLGASTLENRETA